MPDQSTSKLNPGLLELLTHLGHEQLQDLASRFGCMGTTPSRRALSSQVLSKYRDPAFVQDLMNDLSNEARDLLAFLTLLQNHGDKGISKTSVINREEETSIPASKLDELIDIGLVFYHPQDRERVIVPGEIIPAVRDALSVSAVETSRRDTEPVWGGTERIRWMLYRLLACARAGRLRVTQTGVLVKRDLDAWLDSLPTDAVPPPTIPQPPDMGDVADFLFQFGKRARLLKVVEGGIVSTPETPAWLQQGRGRMMQSIWTEFVARIAAKEKHWHRPLFEAVYSSPEDNTFLVIYPSGDGKLPGPLAVWLSWFGLIQVVRGNGHLLALRTADPLPWESDTNENTELRKGMCTLQPNFEMMIPPDMPLHILWEIERFADHHHTDVVSVYHLSRQSIIRGLRDGLSSDNIRKWLHDLTNDRIPQNIRFSLDEWFDSFGRVEVQEVILLRCRSAEIAEDILHLPEADTAIVERLGPNLLSARRSKLEDLLSTLERLGLAPVDLPPAE